MKMNYPNLGQKSAAVKSVRFLLLAFFAMLFMSSGLMAADKEGKVNIPYYVVEFSEVTQLFDESDSILPASLPYAIAKFTRTLTRSTKEVTFIYDDAAPTNRGSWRLKDSKLEPLFPNGDKKNFSAIKNMISVSVSGTTVTFSVPETNVVKFDDFSNIINLEFMHQISDPEEGTNGHDFIKYVSLFESKTVRTFKHEAYNENEIERKSRVEWSSVNNVFNDLNCALLFEEPIDDDYDPEDTSRNTTTYWVTIETEDKLADTPAQGKTLYDAKGQGNAADTRVRLNMGVKIPRYYVSPAAIKDTVIPGATEDTGYTDFDEMIVDAEVVDMTPYASYVSKHWSSKASEVMGVVVGPDNKGYTPSRPDLDKFFLNSQVKYYTVNGIEFFKSSSDQLVDTQTMLKEVPDTANPELMPLNEPYAVLGLNLAGRRGDEGNEAEQLAVVDVQINVPTDSSFNPNTDLANDIQSEYAGITIWHDKDGNGRFDKSKDEKLEVVLDPMSNEMTSPVWTGSGSTYTVRLELTEPKYIDIASDGRPEFFICLTAKPNVNKDQEQPRYGSSFTMEVNDVHFYYKDNCDEDGAPIITKVETDGLFEQKKVVNPFGGPNTFVSYSSDFTNIFDWISKEVSIAFAVKKYKNPDFIEANGLPVPVLAFNMACSPSETVTETLHSIKVRFDASNGFNPKKLADLSDNHTSGISLWKDNKGGDEKFVGVLDPRGGTSLDEFVANSGDTCVPLAASNLKWYIGNDEKGDRLWDGYEPPAANEYFYVLLTPKAAIQLYNDDYFYDYEDATSFDEGEPKFGVNRGMDYFICIRGGGSGRDYSDGNRGLDYGDVINVSVVPGKDFEFGRGKDAVYSESDARKNSRMLELLEDGKNVYANTVTATMPVFFSEPAGDRRLVATAYTAVLGIDVVAPKADIYSFNHLAFQIIDENDTFSFSDYVDSGMTGADSGIALYKDNGDGVFNEVTDTRVKFALSGSVESKPYLSTQTYKGDAKLYLIEMDLDSGSVGKMPVDNAASNSGVDYFLVFKPSRNADPGDKFKVQLWGSDLLGTADDTITFTGGEAGWPRITYKRFETSSYTVATVSNDVYSNLVEKGTMIEPASSDDIAAGGNTSIPALGIRASDPLANATLNKLRIYFDSDNGYDPAWILNPITNSVLDGVQIWDGSKRLAVKAAEWKSDLKNSIVEFDRIDGWNVPENVEVNELSEFKQDNKLVWKDMDNNGVWSKGDALWIANAITDVNKSKYAAGTDAILAGEPLDGTLGTVVTTNTYGFTYMDIDNSGAFNADTDFIFYTGSGRTSLGYYIDLELAETASLPVSADTDSFTVRVRAQDDPRIFGIMRFKLSLLANGITYSTGYSSSSANVSTELISFKSTPAAVSNFNVRRGVGEFTLTWNVPEGNNGNVMIIRAERDAAGVADSEAVPGYPVNQTYYIGDAGKDGQIFKYATTGTAGKPETAFTVTDGFYNVTDEASDVKVVYIGKGEAGDDTTRSYVDNQKISEGKYYYYMAYVADVTNTKEQGTPNALSPSSSKSTSASTILRDQMIEANPWGIKGVAELIRPENISELQLNAGDKEIVLTWENPVSYTNGSILVPADCKIIILRRTGAEIDNGLLQDGNEYTVGQKLGSSSDIEVLSILDGDQTTYTDENLVDISKHYFYEVYAYYTGTEIADYNYSLLPAKADGNSIDLGGVTAYPTSIQALKGVYDKDNETVNLTWTWGDSTQPKLLITRSTSVIANVYPSQGKIYAIGDEIASGVKVIALYSGSSAVYADTAAPAAGVDAYYYAVYSYDSEAGIYNPTETVLAGLTGRAALMSNVNMCGVSTTDSPTDADLNGYIYDESGDQTMNDSDDDGLTDYQELSSDPVTYLNDPYSPAKARSLDLTGAYAYGQVTGFVPPRSEYMTIEFWFRLAATGTSGTILRNAQVTAGSVDEFSVKLAGNKLVYSFLTTAENFSRSAEYALPSGESFEAGVWYHVAIQVSPRSDITTNVRWVLYKNAATPVTYSSSNVEVAGIVDRSARATNLIFGESDSTVAADKRLKFHLDEVRFWAGLRSDGDISDNRFVTVPAASAGLRAYYRFDDGGYTAEDYTKSFAGHTSLADVPPANIAAAVKLLGQNGGTTGKALFSEAVAIETHTEAEPFADSDWDNIPDWWEMKYFGNLTTAGYTADGGYTDFDKDGLNDYYEYLAGTDPTKPDTDGDGTTDAAEDNDSDGLSNLDEQKWGTCPDTNDSDDDGISDGDEVSQEYSPLHAMSPVKARSFRLAALNEPSVLTKGIIVPVTLEESNAGLSSWTVEAWVNPGASAFSGVLMKRVVNGKTGFEIGFNAGELYVKGDCQDGINKYDFKYGAALPASAWSHVAVTWNPGLAEMSMVINGVSRVVFEMESEPYNFWSDWTDGSVSINAAAPNYGSYEIYRQYSLSMFVNTSDWKDDAFVDEVRIWNVAREVSDIFDTRDALVGKGEVGLMRCYRFDDGGASVEDFAHPGWKNFAEYAAYPGVANWFAEGNGVKLYGMDDVDGDGMPDWFESYYGVADAAGDDDGDGLCNIYEYLCGTSPVDKTTDDYGKTCIAGDLTNGEKQLFGLDPRLVDSDGDGFSDKDEIEGTADTFPRGNNDTDTAADPLNPLNNLKPESNPLKHFVFTGTAMDIPSAEKYAVDSWTVMTWVKTGDNTQTASLIRRQVSDKGIAYELGLNNGVPYVKYVTENGDEVKAPADDLTGASELQLEADKWTHLAGSFDNETGVLRLYVNGMAVAETIEEKKRADKYGNGVIGGKLTGAKISVGDGFIGAMDSVQFYDNALDNETLNDIYTVTESGNMGVAESYAQLEEVVEGVDEVNASMSVEQLLAHEHYGNQLLVKFAASVSDEMIERAHATLGTRTLKKYPLTGMYLIEVPENLDIAAGIEKLRQMKAIEFVEPNYVETVSVMPNDPELSRCWGIYNEDYPGIDVGAEEMWNVTTGSGKVVVAVIDSGINYNHADLADNMWVNSREIAGNGIDDDGNGFVDDVYGYDFHGIDESASPDSDPMDENGHGTHVAGTIGAVGNNGKGVAGVNWDVRLMALKVFGEGGSTYKSVTVEAIEYAIANGANVINMSLGSAGYSAAQYKVIKAAQARNVLVVAAAGNDGTDNDRYPHYPSNYELDNVISVAAMDYDGAPCYFTNYGRESVDVAAPGGNIYSTTMDGKYGSMSGTSMACPHVAGMAALLKAAYPKSTYKMLRKALLTGAMPADEEWDGMTVTGGYAYLPRANAVMKQSTGGRRSANGLIAVFRGNAVFNSKALDLVESELGAAAAGAYEAAPEVGRFAADWMVPTVETGKGDYVNFNGDMDGDGMPDWYEVQVSHDPAVADGEEDVDNDGLTNYFEYLAGTSPWNTSTDGTNADAERTLTLDGVELTYADLQRLGVHPKAETSGFEGYDTDDDGVSDMAESGAAKPTVGRADDSLTPYVSRVLSIEAPAGSYLSIPNRAVYAINDNWTVDVWVNVNVNSLDKAVLVKRTVDTLGSHGVLVNYELGIKKDGDFWKPYASFVMRDGKKRECVSLAGIASDVWAHIAAVYSSDADSGEAELAVYINGKLAGSVDCSGIEMRGDEVGLSEIRAGEGFVGQMDALRIWNVAQTNFNNSRSAADDALSGIVPNGLVCSFTFDDGGVTAQNFAARLDDWKEGWTNAAALKAVNGTIAMVESTTAPVVGEEKDSDGDGLPDWWEQYYGLDPFDPSGDNGADGDPDGDGLSNYFEYLTWDTAYPLNPNDPRTHGKADSEVDSDGDKLVNAMEAQYGTDPGNIDTDDDSWNDYYEIFGTNSYPDIAEKSGPLDPLDPVVWRALRSDGTAADTVVIPEEDRLLGCDEGDDLSKDWTVEAWFMPNAADGNTGSILRRSGKDAVGETCYYFDLGLDAGKPYIRATMKNKWIQNDAETNVIKVYAENGIEARKDVWTHYAASWDVNRRTLTLYVNGTFAGSSYAQGAPLVDGGESTTGFVTEVFGELDGKFLKGYVDEVRVWTDTDEGRRGLRLEKQIRQFMSSTPALKTDEPATIDYASLPTAYYRFDDGGKYAEDFAYSINEEMESGWQHSLRTADGALAELGERMVSSWIGGVQDKTGEHWNNAKASERAICVNGSGESDLDPIPDGWQQVYWPDAMKKFGVTPGSGYDFNQNFALNSGLMRTPVDNPQAYPGENSSFVNTVTGELRSNAISHGGGPEDAYLYFTDLYFDNLPAGLEVLLSWSLGGTPGNTTGAYGVNEIAIFVNGHRVGFSGDSEGLPGEDIVNNLTSQALGQKKYPGSFALMQVSSTATISGTNDISKYMTTGRNRITILANHTDYATSNGHPTNYSFTAKVRVNGDVPSNMIDNWPTHVRWFWAQQIPWGYSSAISGKLSSEEGNSYGTTLGYDATVPWQETEEMSHTIEADGTNRPLLWFEKNYAVYPWAFDQDPDGDGLTNWTEFLANTNPLDKDVNGDGRPDSELDFDKDGFFNSVEQALGTMPNMEDTDDDGQNDYYEANNGADPLDGQKAFERDNLVLNLDGKYVLTISELADDGITEELSNWTLQTWVKLPEEGTPAYDRNIILRRTTGRYTAGDVTNYELGITKEGLPYAGFSIIDEGLTNVTEVFAVMEAADGYEPFEGGKWYQVTAVFSAPDAKAQNGRLALYVFDPEGNMTSFVRYNVSAKPTTTVTGIGGGITIGGDQSCAENMDGTTQLDNAFVGQIDNLAIWNRALTDNEIKSNYNDLVSQVGESSEVNFYFLKFASPSYRVNPSLVHAFIFDDGGRSIEDVAIKNDWYNGHAHAISAPNVGSYAIYDVEPDTANPKKDEQDKEIRDADGNIVYHDKAIAGVTNILVPDTTRADEDTKDSDEDGMPDWWEILYGLNPGDASDASGDEDEDGLCNLYEYLSGTNPLVQSTADGVLDGEGDADGDGVPNLDEQDMLTRPDMADTDDDGFSDGLESGYLADTDYIYISSPIQSMQQPNEDYTDVATTAETARVLRLDGTNSMSVKDNPGHSGNTMTIMFWFRAGMQNGGNMDYTADLPADDTYFLGRSVENGGYNYRFSMNQNRVRFWVSRKSTSASAPGVAVDFVPAGGKIKPGEWYLISGVIDVEAATPYIYAHCFANDGTGEYVGRTVSAKFTSSSSNVSEEGTLMVGKQVPATAWAENLVIDIDGLTIWNDAKSAVIIKSATGTNSTSVVGFSDNMVSRFIFDDGGSSCEDFCYEEDWWNKWEHAGVLSSSSAEPVDGVSVGYGMIRDNSLSDMDGDSDHDGLADEWEIYFFGSLKYSGSDDPDGDGMTNKQEYSLSDDFRDPEVTDLSYGNPEAWLNPNAKDTDGDGMPDGWEADCDLNPLDYEDAYQDYDDDGLENLYEYVYGTDCNNPDTDGDGLPDGWEVQYMTLDSNGDIEDPSMDPLNPNGAYGANGDPDEDGIINIDEYTYGTDPTNYDNPNKDSDGDGITDNHERLYNTDPQLTDTDDDEYDDFVEMTVGTEGFNSQSKPSIKIGDGFGYEGNLVAQIMKAKGDRRGCLTVPNANEASRVAFASWTVEARVRLRNFDKSSVTASRDIYVLRRSFTKDNVASNESVADPEAWNYAIGFRLDPEGTKIYPFVSWKAANSIERRVNSDVEKQDIGVDLAVEPSGNGTYQTDWMFISGSYDASTQTLSLYIDGEFIRSMTISNALPSEQQCPVDESKLGNDYVSYLKLGEMFDLEEPAKMLLDEVRVWGVAPGTVEVEGGFISNYTRTDDEIFGASTKSVAPRLGIYDSAIGDRYEFLAGAENDYLIDTRVSDSAWNTPSGTQGISVRVYYEDRNRNGQWDPGEDIWRDRTVAQAEEEDGTPVGSSSGNNTTTPKAVAGSYDEGVDVRLASGGSWQCGVGYSYYVTGADGKTTEVKVSASESLVGKAMTLYFNDINGNGVVDAVDNFWIDYSEEGSNKYQASLSDWAKRMGLVLYLTFDDGGGSIEDYVRRSDWRTTPAWRHAIRPSGMEGTWPPEPKSVGGEDYQFVTQEDSDGFAWVIDAVERPDVPEIEIQTLSDVRNGDDKIEYCYRPVEGSANAETRNYYDLLTAAVLKEAADPEGGTITYKYWWLDSAYYKSSKLYGEVGGPTLVYDGMSLEASDTTDGSLPDGAEVGNDMELDLYIMREDIKVGTKLQLAVVAISSTGKYSDVAIATITVTAEDVYQPPMPFTGVEFTADSYATDNATGETHPTHGANLTVSLSMKDFTDDGIVVLEWYKNGVLYDTRTMDAAASVVFKLNGSVNIGNEVSYITEAGSVWSYKAYYEEPRVIGGKQLSSRHSRHIPPVGDVKGDFDYLLIGSASVDEIEDESVLAGNLPPSTPTRINMTPAQVDENTTIVATAIGSVDPNGDTFSYYYEWYINGEIVANENMPIFPFQDGTRTVTTYKVETNSTTGETTVTPTVTTVAATSFSAGDKIVCKAYAVDIYGSKSGVRISDAITVMEDLSESVMESEAYAYEYNNTWQTATRIQPKENWLDVGDENAQEHYFFEANDVDWFYFVVPETYTKTKKLVKFETNAGDDAAGGMFNSMHMREYDFVDTMATLYRKRPNGKLERVLHIDDYGSITGRGGTKYARFERELEPGEYYVCVALADKSMFSMETPYFAHLGIEEVATIEGPTAPLEVVLTPDSPGVTENLVCSASGSRNAYETSEGIIYHYVWYRNDLLVPFGEDSAPEFWSTDRYLINQSKNHAPSGYGDPNVMPATYTLPGQKWYVVVYAEDENGYSMGVKSNEVIIQSSSWDIQLGVTKTYSSGIGPVEWDDQKVTIGWRANATFGFDPAYDSAVPNNLPDSIKVLSLGRMYAIGLDNEYGMLANDMRPYGISSSWFIKVEAGDDSIDSMELSWEGADMIPSDSLGGLTITRMRQSVAGTFMPVPGTTMNMADVTSIEISGEDLDALQVDEYGQRYVVFRVSLGAPDSMQQITLNPGWNMVSFNVTPLNNNVDDVFANGNTKYYRGTVYEYIGGQYVAATNIRATRGYWVYAPKKAVFVVYGDLESTSISLNKGWNIAGPVYNINDFRKSYADYLTIIDPNMISEFINNGDGTSGYDPISNVNYSMFIGKAYWIYATEAVELPIIPNNH